MRSSIRKSPSASMISVRRLSPCFSRVARSSSMTIFINSASLARIARSRSIVVSNSASSSRIFCRSNPVSRWSCMSRIAWAWISVSENSMTRPIRASAGFFAARISLMTASRWSSAILRPSRTCARASALRRSCSVRRRTTSRRNSIKCSTSSSSLRICGRPATIANIMMLNDACNWVCL